MFPPTTPFMQPGVHVSARVNTRASLRSAADALWDAKSRLGCVERCTELSRFLASPHWRFDLYPSRSLSIVQSVPVVRFSSGRVIVASECQIVCHGTDVCFASVDHAAAQGGDTRSFLLLCPYTSAMAGREIGIWVTQMFEVQNGSIPGGLKRLTTQSG